MNTLKKQYSTLARTLPGKQRGAMTMFSAILILILLTELVLYATQVGVFEQRKSANDVRQKQAFHAAEAGLQNAKEFFLANAQRLSYPGESGWLESGRTEPRRLYKSCEAGAQGGTHEQRGHESATRPARRSREAGGDRLAKR